MTCALVSPSRSPDSLNVTPSRRTVRQKSRSASSSSSARRSSRMASRSGWSKSRCIGSSSGACWSGSKATACRSPRRDSVFAFFQWSNAWWRKAAICAFSRSLGLRQSGRLPLVATWATIAAPWPKQDWRVSSSSPAQGGRARSPLTICGRQAMRWAATSCSSQRRPRRGSSVRRPPPPAFARPAMSASLPRCPAVDRPALTSPSSRKAGEWSTGEAAVRGGREVVSVTEDTRAAGRLQHTAVSKLARERSSSSSDGPRRRPHARLAR